jgi:dihydrofolate reductase
VCVSGGPEAVQQALAARLLDDLEIHLVPVLLGAGTRLFDRIDNPDIRLETNRVLESPYVTHVRYRVLR